MNSPQFFTATQMKRQTQKSFRNDATAKVTGRAKRQNHGLNEFNILCFIFVAFKRFSF